MLLRIIWISIVITTLAILGIFYVWPLEILAPVLFILLLISIIAAVMYDRERGLEHSLLKLKEMGGYFTNRFAGTSSLSIFMVIAGLTNVNNPRIREWVQGCSMSQLIFNAWCDSFVSRIEIDSRAGRLSVYMRTYLRELWSLVTHYQEFIEQFYEVAEKSRVPPETIEQYNRFVIEYNSFIQGFQDYIGNLRGVGKTEIEPPSVKLARELPVKQPAPPEPEVDRKPPGRDEHKGYIM